MPKVLGIKTQGDIVKTQTNMFLTYPRTHVIDIYKNVSLTSTEHISLTFSEHMSSTSAEHLKNTCHHALTRALSEFSVPPGSAC